MSAAIRTPGRTGHAMPGSPVQRLPREAYISPEWFERERRDLFGRTWTWAGLACDLPEAGDYTTVAAGDHPLVVLRDEAGALRAFHNLCRHRGTELVEGAGRLDAARIVCPYHRWTYGLDGALRAVPLHAQCFPGLDPGDHSLLPAALGEFKGMVFVHPDPGADFSEWRADLESVAWPHRFERMRAGPEITYEMRCNWKVFFENAIDGYHLAYLHDRTLGGPRADRNVWDVHGRHLVWYSTETGRKTCMPQAVSGSIETASDGRFGATCIRLAPDGCVSLRFAPARRRTPLDALRRRTRGSSNGRQDSRGRGVGDIADPHLYRRAGGRGFPCIRSEHGGCRFGRAGNRSGG